MPRFSDSVFINCPFDTEYWPIFEGIVFCIIRCGFVPRCALEEADSGQVRLDTIQRIIRDSQYSIHDLSRIELSVESALPRFNMPFELGLDLGCRLYGTGKLKRKKCLILDAQPYRYQAFLSDIAGQDIQYHHNSPDRAITGCKTGCGRPVRHICPGRRKSRVSFWNSLPRCRSIATGTHLTGTTSSLLNMSHLPKSG